MHRCEKSLLVIIILKSIKLLFILLKPRHWIRRKNYFAVLGKAGLFAMSDTQLGLIPFKKNKSLAYVTKQMIGQTCC